MVFFFIRIFLLQDKPFLASLWHTHTRARCAATSWYYPFRWASWRICGWFVLSIFQKICSPFPHTRTTATRTEHVEEVAFCQATSPHILHCYTHRVSILLGGCATRKGSDKSAAYFDRLRGWRGDRYSSSTEMPTAVLHANRTRIFDQTRACMYVSVCVCMPHVRFSKSSKLRKKRRISVKFSSLAVYSSEVSLRNLRCSAAKWILSFLRGITDCCLGLR